MYGAIDCQIGKENADAKNPPKHPFKVQVAMKTSRDVFYFTVPCMVHNLINLSRKMTDAEFEKTWGAITPVNTTELTFSLQSLRREYTESMSGANEAIRAGMKESLFESLASGGDALSFGAFTVNLLAMTCQVTVADEVRVVLKYQVPPLKALLLESVTFILTGQ